MTSDLLEENQDLRKQVADLEKELAISEHDREHDNYELVEVYQRIEQLEKELKAEKEYSATLRKEIDDYTNSHTLCAKYKELEKENAELKEKNEGYCSSRDRLISIGFPTFEDCKEYAEHLTKAKGHIKQLLDCLKQDTNDPQTNYYICQYMDKAEQFLKE